MTTVREEHERNLTDDGDEEECHAHVLLQVRDGGEGEPVAGVRGEWGGVRCTLRLTNLTDR